MSSKTSKRDFALVAIPSARQFSADELTLPTRLAREFGKRFGDVAYAMEGLVVETTSAFMSAKWGVAVEPREVHVQYLKHWLGILKADNRAVFTARSQAQKNVDFCDGLQPAAPTEIRCALTPTLG